MVLCAMQWTEDHVLQTLMVSTVNMCRERRMDEDATHLILDPLITRYEDVLKQQLQASDTFGHVESGVLIGSKEIMQQKEFVVKDCIVDVGRSNKIRVKFLKMTTF